MKERNQGLIRALSILRTCADGSRFTLDQLAREHGVHFRTIRRDFYALEAAGFAVCKTPDSDSGTHVTWWIEGVAASLARRR